MEAQVVELNINTITDENYQPFIDLANLNHPELNNEAPSIGMLEVLVRFEKSIIALQKINDPINTYNKRTKAIQFCMNNNINPMWGGIVHECLTEESKLVADES